MTQLIKIGNSQGVRIPKALIELAQLSGQELKLKLVNNGLLITPEKKIRQGWSEAIDETIAKQGHESVDDDWLDLALDSGDDLQW